MREQRDDVVIYDSNTSVGITLLNLGGSQTATNARFTVTPHSADWFWTPGN